MTSSIRRKILVVDDEATARDVLQRALEKGGYATTTAADGQEALDAASKETFDLVLMDIRMPRFGPWDLTGWGRWAGLACGTPTRTSSCSPRSTRWTPRWRRSGRGRTTTSPSR